MTGAIRPPRLIPFLGLALVWICGCGGDVEPSVRVVPVERATPTPQPREHDWDALPLTEDVDRFDYPGVQGIFTGMRIRQTDEIPFPRDNQDGDAERRTLTFGISRPPGRARSGTPARSLVVSWFPGADPDTSADPAAEKVMLGEFDIPGPDPASESPVADRLAALATIRIPLPDATSLPGALRFEVRPADGDPEDPDKPATALLFAPRLERPISRPPDTPGPPPSILFVISDAHRWDHSLGGRGPELMPRLTEFAASARIPDFAYSPATWTLPAIASLMTGLHPRYHTTGRFAGRASPGQPAGKDGTPPDDIPAGAFAIGRGDDRRFFQAFPSGLTTLPAVLRRCGYRTALIHSNPYWSVSGLAADGFDLALSCDDALGESLNALAGDLLKRVPADEPLFLVVHYMDVHEYLRREFARAWPGEDPWQADAEKVRAAYAEAVAKADAHFGALLEMWDAARDPARSMTAFMSDHGEHLFDPGRHTLDPQEYDGRWNTGVLDHGNTVEDVLLRVPLAVRFPRAADPSSAALPAFGPGRAVSLIDLFPTALDLIGLEESAVPGLHGRSMLRPVDGEPRVLHSDYQLYGADLSTVRRGDLKLVVDRMRHTRRLVDRTLPYLPGGEAGQTFVDEVAEAELSRIADQYDAHAWLAARELSAGERHATDAAEALSALGYLR